jgi:hypothetical protein
MRYHVCKKRTVSGNILRDDEITLKTKKSKGYYPKRMRRIVASVEVNGKNTEMVSSLTTWTGLPPVFAIYIKADGRSKSSLNKSSKRSKSAIVPVHFVRGLVS